MTLSAMGTSLRPLFEPASICLVGASADPAKQSGRPLLRLTQHGFQGEIYLVNPRYDEIGGFPCYPSIDQVPSPTDIAVVMLSAPLVPAAVRACGERGIGFAVVLSSGFDEVSGGSALGDELRRAAQETGIRIVGPNSVGLWNLPAHTILTLGTAAARERLIEGPVTVLSQSGSIGAATVRLLQDRGVGCRYFVSLGNEADLTAMDFLEFVVADGKSRVVALFLEGLHDGARLRQLIYTGREQGMRFVVLQVGASEAGRNATATHTGKMATAKKVYTGIFRQCGVVEVDTVTELIDAAEVLSLADAPPALGSDAGVGVLAISGGSRAVIADACGRRGVAMATLLPETEKFLRDTLPPVGYPRNPIDVDGLAFEPEKFREVIEVVARDGRIEALLIQYANQSEEQIRADMEFLRGIRMQPARPIGVSFVGRAVDPSLKRMLADQGILYAVDPDDAVKHLSWLYSVRMRGHADIPEASHSPVDAVPSSWPDLANWLAGFGISTPAWRIIEGGLDGAAVVDLAPPFVVKALPEQAAHKTEYGLVHLDVRTEEEVTAAVTDIRSVVGEDAPVLVQEMVRGSVEVVLAARDDPDCGPVLAIGTGGIAVELFEDVAYLALPATDEEFLDAVDSLKLRRLLDGYRGRAPRDIGALLRTAQALTRAFFTLPGGVRELEINPLCVLEDGAGVVAVDVLVRADGAPKEGL